MVMLLGPFLGWGHGGIAQRPNSWASPQGLDQRSKIEVVPNMACWRGSDAGELDIAYMMSAGTARRYATNNVALYAT